MNEQNIKIHRQGKTGNPVLLFLHAFPFTGQMWKEQMNLFSEKFDCVSPDLPGFGESALPNNAVTFEFYVDSVLNYLRDNKIEKSIWCGLSMGGYLALRMYERAPEQCRALILCDTKAEGDSNEAKIKRWGAIQLLQKSREEFVALQWQTLVGESSKNNKGLKIIFEELVTNVNSDTMRTGLVALATRTDCRARLSEIGVPTLILVGEEDKVTPVVESQEMAKSITGSQLKILDKTGHLSNLENPSGFNDQLSDFLLALK